jgi:hypothetical protein
VQKILRTNRQYEIPHVWGILLLLVSCWAFGCNPGDDAVSKKDIKMVMEAHAPDLMDIQGVTAVAIGQLGDGTPCIKVYVVEKSDELEDKIPDRLEGHPVVIEESGEIKPMRSD